MQSFFTGIVESRHDPLKIGRVKVRVHGIHNHDKSFLPTEDLPWAIPVQSINSAASSGVGWSPTGIIEGTTVMVVFIDDEDMQKPFVLGTIAGIPTDKANPQVGFDDPNGVYPLESQLNKSDVPSRALNESVEPDEVDANIPAGLKAIWSEPESAYGAVYPTNHVYSSESGHTQEFDDTPGKERIATRHRSGSRIQYLPNGDLVTKIVNDRYSLIAGDDYIYVAGNISITTDSNVQILCKQSAEIVCNENLKAKVLGNLQVSVDGDAVTAVKGKYTIHSDDELILSGKKIHLNTAGKITPNDLVPDLDITAIDEALQPDEPDIDTGLDSSSVQQLQQRSGVAPGTVTAKDETIPPTESTKEEIVADCALIPDQWTYETRLSSRFSIGSLSKDAVYPHPIVAQHGLSQKQIICNLMQLVTNIIEPFCNRWGNQKFQINSGFRVGGSISQHERGQAVDIQMRGWTVEQYVEAAKWVRDNLPFDQCILEYGGKNPWLHISYKPGGRKKMNTRTAAGDYVSGILTLS